MRMTKAELEAAAAPKAANAALMKTRKSAGRHTVAVFRQNWIDKVIKALSG